GACVGVRGNRIKNIVDELAGERIDIVRWSDDMQVLIPNALQPAEVEEVILCSMLGRAIVLVREDQLSLAIGRRGQNVRLASKLCGWDIEIMTREELDEQIERAVAGFSALEGVDENLSEKLVGEGFLSYDDLSVIEPDALMEMGGLSMEQVDLIVRQAEQKAEEAEAAASEERRRQREQQRIDAATAALEAEERAAQLAAGIDPDAAKNGDGLAAGPLDDAQAKLDAPGYNAVDQGVADERVAQDSAGQESAAGAGEAGGGEVDALGGPEAGDESDRPEEPGAAAEGEER
ncbi:MAG: transcription termination factor NusA, partial [Pirellulales bacterium]